MNILEVKNLQKSFGSTAVLNGISFSLERGNILAVIGSSGGGKSTLLRCLNFLEIPDSGEIRVMNTPLTWNSEKQIRENRRHFGLVFQNFNLFSQYTVLENILLSPVLLKTGSRADLERQARSLLAQVGLSEKANSYPCQLSGGQQQRAAIARALALNPDVLCFDEPTSALDPRLTGEVLQVIRELKQCGKSIILVTHDMAFAKEAADVVLYISDGIVEEVGTAEEIFSHPRSSKTKAFLQTSLN